jgi:hypothetical protein
MHPKDAPIEWASRFTRGRGAGETSPPPPPPPVQELFVLPVGGQGVHLNRAMDCPRCLERGPGEGVVVVSFSLHYAALPLELGGFPAVGLGLTATPRLVAGERSPDEPHAVTACTAGCELTRDEWEVVLGAAFLEICQKYAEVADRTKG